MGKQISKQESFRLLSNTEQLPTVPDLLHDIFNASVDLNFEIEDVVELIKRDQSIVVMVIRMANSSFYNRNGTDVLSIEKAVIKIGIVETINVAMCVTLSHGVLSGVNAEHISQFWVKSFLTAKASLLIAKKLDPLEGSIKHGDVYLTALLQSIGRVALSSAVDLCYFDDVMCQLKGEEILVEERRRYGIDYIEAGSFLLQVWGIPQSIYDNIRLCDFHVNGAVNIGNICCQALLVVSENMQDIKTFEDVNSIGIDRLKDIIGV